MGKKSRKSTTKQSSTPRARSAHTLPPLDITSLDTTKCCICEINLAPLSWTRQDFSVWSCCGNSVCRPCERNSKRGRLSGFNKDARNRETGARDEKMPELLQLLATASCEACGMPPNKSETENVDRLRRLADAGHAGGQFILAVTYCQGYDDVPRDLERAVMLLRAAAQQGHAVSCAALGDCYRQGTGAPVSLPNAKYWYELAVDEASALYQLSLFYRLGKEVDVDNNKADELCLLSAEQGYPPAIHDYAISLVARNKKEEALAWIIKGGGDETNMKEYRKVISGCQFLAGKMLFDPFHGTQTYRATLWLNRAGQNGCLEAKALAKMCLWFNCSHCQQRGPKLLCSGCKASVYCDRACQKAHWKEGGHKGECSPLPKEIWNENLAMQCSNCGKQDPSLMCTRCAIACYCSAQCQREHWLNGNHKRSCSIGAKQKNV